MSSLQERGDGLIIYDEASDFTKEEWEEMTRRIPKKKRPKGDPRRAKFSARQFGNIILSNTSQIIGNTTLSDALAGGSGETIQEVQELLEPVFDEFFLNQGDKWQIIGPMKLSAQEISSGKWKSVSAIGGEILHYKGVDIGSRDGVCIIWETGNIIGLEDEMVINTTIKKYGDQIVPAQLAGNPANGPTFIDLLLNNCGEADVVTAAEEAKARVVELKAKSAREEIERKSEAYGEGFGSWA